MGALLLVFTPAIIIIRARAPTDATAIAVAMWSPLFLLLPACLARLVYNLNRMNKGLSGPWNAAFIVEYESAGVDDAGEALANGPASTEGREAPAPAEVTDQGDGEGTRRT